jgi:hypothetical protein
MFGLLPKLKGAILRHDSRDEKRVGNSQAGALLPCFCSPYPTCQTLAGTFSLSLPYSDVKPKLPESSVPMCRCEKPLQSRVQLRFAGWPSPLYDQLHQETMGLVPRRAAFPATEKLVAERPSTWRFGRALGQVIEPAAQTVENE